MVLNICFRCNKVIPKGNKFCDKCKKERLQVNNPNGYNKHKPNPTPPAEELNQIEKFKQLGDLEQRKLISELGNKIYRLKRELQPILLEFNKYKEYYEKRLYNWEFDTRVLK